MAYKIPPIMEAVIDIQVTSQDGLNISSIEGLHENIKKQYPNKEGIFLKTANIDINKEESIFVNDQIGIKLSSSDKKYFVQFKKTGFTFSISNAYEGWDALYSQAQALWKLFVKHTSPRKVTRVAVRYINKIDIPAIKFKLEDYFQIYPKVFDADLSGFFLQIQIPQTEGGLAVIHQTVTTPSQVGYTSILLDLDVFDLQNFDPEDEELWKRIALLRKQKNNLFEKCITDKARELF